MSENIISPLHIEKLGHELQEIRERALLNVNSKLQNGLGFNNDLAGNKQLLTKLFQWFLHEPCTKQDVVLNLIKHILKSEPGNVLIQHVGSNKVKKEVFKIKTYIEPCYHSDLEEILQIIDNNREIIVPPLETDVPLSYRSGESDRIVGSPETITGFVHQESSRHQQLPAETPDKSFIIFTLKWQTLIESDRQILQSVENSLRKPPEPSALIHSSEFFCNILLRDFPAEVFLQRPKIISIFFNLLKGCVSIHLSNILLECLVQLTRALQVRIKQFEEIALHNSKQIVTSQNISCASSPSTVDECELPQVTDLLKTQQITFPQFCYCNYKAVFDFLMIKPDARETKRKDNQKGINTALELLEENLKLVVLIVGPNLWTDRNSEAELISRQFREVLTEYGDILEYYRIESISNDSNTTLRAYQISLLKNCVNFLEKLVPLSQSGFVLPKIFKNALANVLVDVALSKLHSEIYQAILKYVQSFSVGVESANFNKYEQTNKICASMSSAVMFLKEYRNFKAADGVNVAIDAIPCVEFHKNLGFIRKFLDFSARKLPLYPYNEDLAEKFEYVILKLLAHNIEKIKEETYKSCMERVDAEIGPKLNTSQIPGSEILFLLRANIFIEFACHGLTSNNSLVQNCADDILIYILKCKVLVCEDIWNSIIQALIPALPILLCHANKTSTLGKILINFIDPDTAKDLFLPQIEVIKANIHVLFGTDSQLREEAFSRLCWLLAFQRNSKEMLPRLNNLSDKTLPNACQLQRIIDLNKSRNLQHFYQPSSLHQVLDLLRSDNIEPVIRRSALTQISVMMEDCLLHNLFLEQEGLELVLNIMQQALVEKNYNHYPDSVVAIIAILKHLCLTHRSVRDELRNNMEVLYNVLRGLFMFFTEERLRHDAAVLLFIMVTSDFVQGNPSKGDLSIPNLLNLTLRVPFICNTHWEVSEYFEENCYDTLTKDKTCFNSIKVQWNSLLLGGFDELLSCPQIDYENMEMESFLKLNDYDLFVLKASSSEYAIKKSLILIQNATSHDVVFSSLHRILTYLQISNADITNQPWELSTSRFLRALPSSEEDAKLLSDILVVLKHLVEFYKSSDNWICDILKNPSCLLLDLITTEDGDNDSKILSRNLLNLIKTCAIRERYLFDFHNSKESITSWMNVIEIIANTLESSGDNHFSNLSNLDCLLSCLVHLTSTIGWNPEKSKQIFHRLVRSLLKLLIVFHDSKGSTSTTSVMGLNIIRNVVLILNNLLSEMQHLSNWDEIFLYLDQCEWIKTVSDMWNSRDVVLRAGSLQFFAGISNSPKLTSLLIKEMKHESGGIWHESLNIFTDLDEANIVRENAAYLLGNLVRFRNSHVTSIPEPEIVRKERIDPVNIFDLLDEYRFYKYLNGVVESLYTNVEIESETTARSSTTSYCLMKTTPAFIKAISSLIFNLITMVCDGVCGRIQDANLTKLFFRCITFPVMPVDDLKNLWLYCEILEMDTAICTLLTKLIQVNVACYGTVLHTNDCMRRLVGLLNHKNYHTHTPALTLIRNKLFCEIYRLLSTLITHNYNNEVGIILPKTIEAVSCEDFIETTIEAIRSTKFEDLQNNSLLFLTTFLELESLEDSFLSKLLDTKPIPPGALICSILLKFYELSNLQTTKESKKDLILLALSALLSVSNEGKHCALHQALPEMITKQFKDLHMKLSLECIDSLRRTSDKKRVGLLLKNMDELVGLSTNFALGHEKVKEILAELGLCDLLHKLWAWFSVQKTYLINCLKLMSTMTTNCPQVCQSMPLTCCTAGSGLRKVPAKITIIHALITLIDKEMDSVSRTHDLTALELSFTILSNCCIVNECRIIFCKSNLLYNLNRIHPAMTKRQKPWDAIEMMWLKFLQNFTLYPEGQTGVAKNNEAFEILILLANNGKNVTKTMALCVLRNISFYQSNRSRLLTSDDFIKLLESKLDYGRVEEKRIAVVIMWALAANNQRAKNLFKSARLDFKLELARKEYELGALPIDNNDIERIHYVLAMIRDGSKNR